MTRRKICVMGRVLDQDDGLGVYSYNLLKNMIEQDQSSDYRILLRTNNSKHLLSAYDNVSVEVIPAKVKTFWDQIHVPLAAKKYNADIIFNPKFSLPIFTKTAGVFVLQASDWYVNPRNYKWWDNIYIKMMIPIYSKKAKQLLAISQCVLNDLVKFANVDQTKVTVTYAAPSPHFKVIDDGFLLKKYADRYKLPARFIFCVARTLHTGHGRLPEYPGGNVEGLIKGYRYYQSNGGSLPLVIAGRNIDTYLNNRGLLQGDSRDVIFTGFVPHDEIVYLYNLAEFFVLTTLYESFAFPIVEAMASGCPAIIPSTGACPEVAGGAAQLANPRKAEEIGNALMELEQSPQLREKMRKEGLIRAKHFTWRRTAALTLRAFDKIKKADP